jgi:hypothetical protein
LGCFTLLRDDVGEVFFDTIIGFVAETERSGDGVVQRSGTTPSETSG